MSTATTITTTTTTTTSQTTSQTASRTTSTAGTVRFDDETARRRAIEHAVSVLGLAARPDVAWRHDYRLQGHLDLRGRHLVLIAPRTDDRPPRLLTEQEWDRLRHGVAA